MKLARTRILPFSPGTKWVVGVSGGSDSIALLYFLTERFPKSSRSLIIAHVNYGLRGRASDLDEEFVANLCLEMGLPLYRRRVKGLRERARREGRSLQDLAREIRYLFFKEIVKKEKANGVAVGHHQDDQAETVMDRILRGAGPKGLTGLRKFHSLSLGGSSQQLLVWRPLLSFSKKGLKTILEKSGRRWREDFSNRALYYRRNRIRHKIIPFLKRLNPKMVENLARIGEISSEEDSFIECMASQVGKRIGLRTRGKVARFKADRLFKEHLALQRRWIRSLVIALFPGGEGLSFERVQEALGVLRGQISGPRDLGRGIFVKRMGPFGILGIRRFKERNRELKDHVPNRL